MLNMHACTKFDQFLCCCGAPSFPHNETPLSIPAIQLRHIQQHNTRVKFSKDKLYNAKTARDMRKLLWANIDTPSKTGVGGRSTYEILRSLTGTHGSTGSDGCKVDEVHATLCVWCCKGKESPVRL